MLRETMTIDQALQVLELTRPVAVDVVKKTYKKLALQYHPDKNLGDAAAAEKFKDISHAKTVIDDNLKKNPNILSQEPVQRKTYDTTWANQWRQWRQEEAAAQAKAQAEAAARAKAEAEAKAKAAAEEKARAQAAASAFKTEARFTDPLDAAIAAARERFEKIRVDERAAHAVYLADAKKWMELLAKPITTMTQARELAAAKRRASISTNRWKPLKESLEQARRDIDALVFQRDQQNVRKYRTGVHYENAEPRAQTAQAEPKAEPVRTQTQAEPKAAPRATTQQRRVYIDPEFAAEIRRVRTASQAELDKKNAAFKQEQSKRFEQAQTQADREIKRRMGYTEQEMAAEPQTKQAHETTVTQNAVEPKIVKNLNAVYKHLKKLAKMPLEPETMDKVRKNMKSIKTIKRMNRIMLFTGGAVLAAGATLAATMMHGLSIDLGTLFQSLNVTMPAFQIDFSTLFQHLHVTIPTLQCTSAAVMAIFGITTLELVNSGDNKHENVINDLRPIMDVAAPAPTPKTGFWGRMFRSR